jgi:hypothetical protein
MASRRSVEPKWNAEAKDQLEQILCDMLCGRQLDLTTAQEPSLRIGWRELDHRGDAGRRHGLHGHPAAGRHKVPEPALAVRARAGRLAQCVIQRRPRALEPVDGGAAGGPGADRAGGGGLAARRAAPLRHLPDPQAAGDGGGGPQFLRRRGHMERMGDGRDRRAAEPGGAHTRLQRNA